MLHGIKHDIDEPSLNRLDSLVLGFSFAQFLLKILVTNGIKKDIIFADWSYRS